MRHLRTSRRQALQAVLKGCAYFSATDLLSACIFRQVKRKPEELRQGLKKFPNFLEFLTSKELTLQVPKSLIPLYGSELSFSVRDPTMLTFSEMQQGEIRLKPTNKAKDWTTLTVQLEISGQLEKKDIIVSFNHTLVKNTHAIEGYTNSLSYQAGDVIAAYIHAPDGRFTAQVMRFGKKITYVSQAQEYAGMAQDYLKSAAMTGANWRETFRIKVGDDWRSGLYGLKVHDRKNTYHITPFIVRNSLDSHPDIVFLACTNTWNAYNPWGDASAYRYNLNDGTKRAFSMILSFQRPHQQSIEDDFDHVAGGDKHIVRWLEEQNYNYAVISDSDLDAAVPNAKLLMTGVHPDYWTDNMRENLLKFMDRGGSVAYLGANGIYWRVELDAQGLMEVRKDRKMHTLKRHGQTSGKQGGKWRILGKSECQILGVRYESKGAGTYAPYEVKAAQHWLFAGTDVKNGAQIGRGIKYNHASGGEMDRQTSSSPKNAVLLAKGLNPENSGAEMTYYEHPAGGKVFAAGSLSFAAAMLEDKVLSRIVSNFLNAVL